MSVLESGNNCCSFAHFRLITPEQAAKLCDRNFGVGADRVIFALPGTNGADYTMRIYNSDGSEPEVIDYFIHSFLYVFNQIAM